MESKSEHLTADNGASVEVGTVTHEGKEFAALGSVIDEKRGEIVGYPAKIDQGHNVELRSWDGRRIEGLELRRVSTWATPNSWQSSTRSAYRATYKGQRYHGTGFGEGMLLRLRRAK